MLFIWCLIGIIVLLSMYFIIHFKTIRKMKKKEESKKSNVSSLPTLQDYLNYVKSEQSVLEENGVGYSHYVYVK